MRIFYIYRIKTFHQILTIEMIFYWKLKKTLYSYPMKYYIDYLMKCYINQIQKPWRLEKIMNCNNEL